MLTRKMCQACISIQHRIEEAGRDGNIKTYCATGCVKGNSFMSKDKGCIPCDSLEELAIPNEDQARIQCTACKNRVWRIIADWGPACVLRKCPDGYFKHFGLCRKCIYPKGANWTVYEDFYSAVLWDSGGYYNFKTSEGNLLEEWSQECLNCANATDPNLRKKYQVAYNNNRWVCTDICGSTQFQVSSGACYDCDTDLTSSLGTSCQLAL